MARSENLTIMFTDMVNYTQRTSVQSRAQNRAMLRRQNQLMLPLVRRFGGRPIKSIGDALLIVFRSPTDAVRCGMAMHDALAEDNARFPPAEHIHIRVAINLGEVAVDGGDVFGEAVNVASRVEGLTPADEIYFTEAVYLAMNKAEVPSKVIGTETLKGIPEPVKLYCVPSRTITRLTVAAEGIGTAPGELPYGGMHRMESQSRSFRVMAFLRMLLTRVQDLVPGGRSEVLAPRVLGVQEQRRRLLIGGGVLAGALVLGALLSWAVSNLEPGAPDAPVAGRAPAAAAAPGDPAPPVEPAVDETERQRELMALAQFRQQVDVALSQDRLGEAEALVQKRLTEKPKDPVATLFRGHLLYAQGRVEAQGRYPKTEAALRAYGEALAADASLRDDPRLAANLVSALGRVTGSAKPLLVDYPSEQAIALLARRSGETGIFGRNAAVTVLHAMGQAERIDGLGYYIWELQERSTCEQRRVAAVELGKYRDRRALPVLEKAISGFKLGWVQNGCLRIEAAESIRQIEGKN